MIFIVSKHVLPILVLHLHIQEDNVFITGIFTFLIHLSTYIRNNFNFVSMGASVPYLKI